METTAKASEMGQYDYQGIFLEIQTHVQRKTVNVWPTYSWRKQVTRMFFFLDRKSYFDPSSRDKQTWGGGAFANGRHVGTRSV